MEVPGRKDRETSLTSLELLIYCSPCKAEGEQETAEGYCEVCHEYLCPACISCHKKFKMTKGHRILQGDAIPTDSTGKPYIDTSCTEVCAVHPEKFIEYFCEDHDTVGCGPCTLINHRTCKLSFVPDVAKKYRESDEYKTLLSTMTKIESHLSELEDKLDKQGEETEYIHSSAINDIRRFRAEVNKYLDKKEEKLLEKANHYKQENDTILQDIRGRRERLHKQFTEIKDQLQKNTNEVSKLFLDAKRLGKTVQKLNGDCSIMLTKLDIIQYSFKASEKLKEIVSDENYLGEILRRHETCVSKLDITFTHKVKVTHCNVKTTLWITGICLVSPDKVLMVDLNKRSLNEVDTCSQNITATLGLTAAPCDATCLPDVQAAVTIPGEKKIQIVSTREGLSIVREIKVSGQCCGICYSDSKLIVTYRNPGKLEIVDLEGNVHRTVITDYKGNTFFINPLHVTLQSTAEKKYVYVSDAIINTVTKLNLEGEVISQFQDKRLCGPFGLVAIGDNHIAVCSHSGHKIIVIRDEGGKMDIVKQWDCVQRPYAIEFSPMDSKVYVSSRPSNEQDYIFVYDLSE